VLGPFMHAVKCLQAESVIFDHCTGTVNNNNKNNKNECHSNIIVDKLRKVKKNRSMSTALQ